MDKSHAITMSPERREKNRQMMKDRQKIYKLSNTSIRSEIIDKSTQK